MAAQVQRRHGIPAESLSADTPDAERRTAQDRLRDRRGQLPVRRRPVQRGGRHPRGRHGAVPAADREPDGLPPAARPRAAAVRGQGVPDRPRLRRPGAPQLPVRPALPGAADRPVGAGRRAGRARVHAPAGRLHDPDGAGGPAARPGEHPPGAAADPLHPGPGAARGPPRPWAGAPTLGEFLERAADRAGRPLPPRRQLRAALRRGGARRAVLRARRGPAHQGAAADRPHRRRRADRPPRRLARPGADPAVRLDRSTRWTSGGC